MDNAYVTMLCSGDGYVTGAEVLGRSLETSGSKVPRIAMVTPDIIGLGWVRGSKHSAGRCATSS